MRNAKLIIIVAGATYATNKQHTRYDHSTDNSTSNFYYTTMSAKCKSNVKFIIVCSVIIMLPQKIAKKKRPDFVADGWCICLNYRIFLNSLASLIKFYKYNRLHNPKLTLFNRVFDVYSWCLTTRWWLIFHNGANNARAT